MARDCRPSEKSGGKLDGTKQLSPCPIAVTKQPGTVLVLSHRLFDEMVSIPQSSRTMRLLISWLFLATTSIAAWAQTNVPPNVRQLSLQDCIEMALRHNLDLQIERYVPKIALYNLRGAYGGYDPTFS